MITRPPTGNDRVRNLILVQQSQRRLHDLTPGTPEFSAEGARMHRLLDYLNEGIIPEPGPSQPDAAAPVAASVPAGNGMPPLPSELLRNMPPAQRALIPSVDMSVAEWNATMLPRYNEPQSEPEMHSYADPAKPTLYEVLFAEAQRQRPGVTPPPLAAAVAGDRTDGERQEILDRYDDMTILGG